MDGRILLQDERKKARKESNISNQPKVNRYYDNRFPVAASDEVTALRQS